MKIVFHPRYTEVYASDPAASSGRIEAILKELEGRYDFVEPRAASEDDLRRVHIDNHIESVKRDKNVYDIACLAAGGAVKAAQIAMDGEPSFGLIRPPGHHASPDHCWGFCYFNNIAVALARLQDESLIEKSLILDFDLHFGDGTNNFFLKVVMLNIFTRRPETGKSLSNKYPENSMKRKITPYWQFRPALTVISKTGVDCLTLMITGLSDDWSRKLLKRIVKAEDLPFWKAAITTMSWGETLEPL